MSVSVNHKWWFRGVLVKSALKNASDLAAWIVFQAIPPFEFAFKDERISLTIVDAVISPPSVPKGTICKDLNVYPAECRGRKSTYRGRLTVSISDILTAGGCPCTLLKLGLVPLKWLYLHLKGLCVIQNMKSLPRGLFLLVTCSFVRLGRWLSG